MSSWAVTVYWVCNETSTSMAWSMRQVLAAASTPGPVVVRRA
jgi:hypothetical protein